MMTSETLREYLFRKEVERCQCDGVEPPYEMLGAPVGRLKDAIEGFFAGYEEHRRRRADDALALKEERSWQREQVRKVTRNATKKAGRRIAAMSLGADVRTRTDLSGMSEQDAADHRREVERNRKRRNRVLEKSQAASEVVSDEELEWLKAILSDLDLSVGENNETVVVESPQSPAGEARVIQAAPALAPVVAEGPSGPAMGLGDTSDSDPTNGYWFLE